MISWFVQMVFKLTKKVKPVSRLYTLYFSIGTKLEIARLKSQNWFLKDCNGLTWDMKCIETNFQQSFAMFTHVFIRTIEIRIKWVSWNSSSICSSYWCLWNSIFHFHQLGYPINQSFMTIKILLYDLQFSLHINS